MRKIVRHQDLPIVHLLARRGAQRLPQDAAKVPVAWSRYEGKVLAQDPCGWYENERRLYVWYILCYMKLKSLEPVDFVDGYNRYWTDTSAVFWGKTIPFLKYQLLSLIKAKGRINWKKEEDDLLLEAYK